MYAHMERVWYQCDKNLPTIEQKLFLRVLMTFVFFWDFITDPRPFTKDVP